MAPSCNIRSPLTVNVRNGITLWPAPGAIVPPSFTVVAPTIPLPPNVPPAVTLDGARQRTLHDQRTARDGRFTAEQGIVSCKARRPVFMAQLGPTGVPAFQSGAERIVHVGVIENKLAFTLAESNVADVQRPCSTARSDVQRAGRR